MAATILIATYFFSYVTVGNPLASDLMAQDVEAYWAAAERLKAGAPLYAPHFLPYTYAPWFAAAWIPLTWLPRDLVEVVWVTCLLATVAWLHAPLRKSWTGILVAMLIGPWVVQYAWIGNVDALMLAALGLLHTRAGPYFVGLAASLKLTPIAFAIYYVAAGQRKRAMIALLVAVALWLPALAFDLSTFGDAGRIIPDEFSLTRLGWQVWAGVAGLITGVVAVAAIRNRGYVLLACAVAAMLANPRAGFYSLGYLVVPSRFH